MSRGCATCTCLSETFTLTRSGRTLTCERYNPVITAGIENANEGGLNFLTLSRAGYWPASGGAGLYISQSMQMLNIIEIVAQDCPERPLVPRYHLTDIRLYR